MAVIHDVMPAFELFQPASIGDVVTLLDRYGAGRLGDGGRDGFLRLAEGSHQAPERGHRSEPGPGAARHQGAERRPRDRRRHDAHRGRARSAGARQVRVAGGGRRARGLAADPQPGDHRRQRVAGHALLVLPRRVVVLPGGRQHLLCRHADRDQSRARDSGSRPLRGGEPVRHGAGAGRARCADGHPERARRARRQCRGLLHRPGGRHHPHDGAGARTSC